MKITSRTAVLKSASRMVLAICSLLFTSIQAQQSYTFTNCGATGRFGPTQTMVTTAYAGSNLSLVATTSATSGIQTWTVPYTGMFRITAIGASGGDATGGPAPGNGAIMRGDFMLNSGEVIQILVGQMGQDRQYSAGGGGATYVVRTPYNATTAILVVAGGGGASSADFAGLSAVTATCGTFDVSSGPAQCAGSGGLSFTGNSGGGGGGFLTDGQAGGIGDGGKAYVNGGFGGSSNNQQTGGFGGGGGQNGTGTYAGSAGGGFSGGNGGNRANAREGGGGGGSINFGTNQLNSVSTSTGHGRVIITELCNISLTSTNFGTVQPSICSGTSVTLTTNAISNYSWSTNQTSSVIVVTPLSTTVYSLFATSSSNCNAMATVTVLVSQAVPALTVTSSGLQVCPGQSLSLNAAGAISYSWSGGITNGQLFAPASSTNYVVTGQNGCGTATAGVNVTVSPLPISIASTASAVCQGSTAIISTTAIATSYTWSPGGQTTSSILVSPLSTTIYTVAATDGTCSGTNTISISSIASPTLTTSTTNTSICQGESATITVSGASTYTWASGATTGNSLVVSPNTNTVYQVSGTSNNGCGASTQQIILVQSSPIVSTSANPTLVCAFGSSTLSAQSSGNTFTWSVGGNNSSTAVSPSVSSIYTIICGHGANICTTSATVEVVVLQTSVTLPTNTMTCKGIPVVITSLGADEYIWNGFPSGTQNTYTATGNNSETITLVANTTSNNVTCPINHSIAVLVNPTPTIIATPNRSVMCKGETNTITASGAITYTWNTATTGASAIVSPTALTTYTVIGTDGNGCESKSTVNLFVNACTGISELNQMELTLYPNPSDGSYFISTNYPTDAFLYNASGLLILTFHIDSSYQMDISYLDSGIYFLVSTSEKGNKQTKLVLSK